MESNTRIQGSGSVGECEEENLLKRDRQIGRVCESSKTEIVRENRGGRIWRGKAAKQRPSNAEIEQNQPK